MKSKRFEVLGERPVNKDGFIKEWPEKGLIAMDSPLDPKPSVKINIENAEKVMAMKSVDIAKMLVDINVSREEVLKVTLSMTPAKAAQVMTHLTVLEMMMAVNKMRARRTPANQCHVTNLKDNPVQIAADAAEAALRGFAEAETTVGIVRYAPFNALALLVGAQVGRPGVLTQCAVEEATELLLGMRALTNYAETVSVYGTEQVFIDGDDTPWSKTFLASAYASRGLKMRYTSGSGSEVLMGYAEGCSMLYLETRCLFVTKGGGVQGIQNGSVSCVGVPGAVPGGIREILAENLVAMLLDLECASSNDQTFTHSDIRKTARSLMQMIPGTDFICSGYSSTPNYDNMFAGSNWDAEDFDDWNIIQRDLKIDAGLHPVDPDEVIKARNKAARAIQGIFDVLGFPEVTDEEVEAATNAHGSKDMPDRDVVRDLKAAQELMERGITGVDLVKALKTKGFDDVASDLLQVLKLRISGDLLHTSAILDGEFNVISAINDRNNYSGPGTGYQISDERWEKISNIPNAIDPSTIK